MVMLVKQVEPTQEQVIAQWQQETQLRVTQFRINMMFSEPQWCREKAAWRQEQQDAIVDRQNHKERMKDVEYRKSYLHEVIAKDTAKLDRFHNMYRRHLFMGKGDMLRIILEEATEYCMKVVEKNRKHLYILENGFQGKIGPHEIGIAHDSSFKELLGVRKFPCLCPFHSDKHPSLFLWKKGNRVHCWACGYFADPIQFMMDKHKIRFVQAVEALI